MADSPCQVSNPAHTFILFQLLLHLNQVISGCRTLISLLGLMFGKDMGMKKKGTILATTIQHIDEQKLTSESSACAASRSLRSL